MAWTGVITNAGAALLDQWSLGGEVTITSAATGTGTVPEAAMLAQTALVSQQQTASIIEQEKLDAGIKLRMQITAPAAGYTLQQYGVWAKLDSGAPVMLALFQNPTGVAIPSSAESPDFVYTLFALLKIANTGDLTVDVDTSALVSQSTLDEAMATKVDKVTGKGLSTNDYTTAEKEKLAGIEAQANKYIHPSYTARTGKPTANLTPGFGDTVTVSQITSDASGHVTGATDRTIKIPATAASTSAAGLMSAADKTKLNGVATGAEVNQNAFSSVKVGSTTIAADAKTDTLEIVAGDNITLTPDATNDKVTIKATDTTYSSKAAASGGTAVSLVTTGEKYTWNSKAAGSHTHGAGDISSGTLPVARGGTGQTTAAAAASALLSELNDTGATLDVTDNTLIATSASGGETGTWYRRAAIKFWNYIKGKADSLYAALSHTHAIADVTNLQTTLNGKAASSHTHSADDVTSGTLPVARGGTGKTTTLEALTYLGGASIKSIGTAIDAGTDLNTLITAGTYYSANADRSASLVNAPTTASGFKLFVVTSYQTARVIQYAIVHWSIYVRYSDNATGASPSWSNWDSFSRNTHTHDAGDIDSGTLAAARLPAATASTQGAVKLGASGGAAAYSHTHAAGDITSGTLAAARLPAATASTQGAVKLGASGGAAAYSHTHSADDVTSGTLAVARGGTGKTTAKDAASALIVALGSATADVRDETLISTSDVTGETNTWYKRPATAFWNYIKGKADAVYAAIGHTHTVPSLGGGYATCSTAAGTFAKTASLSGYTLKAGGIVVVKFTKASTCAVDDDHPDVTLNINSTGAKPIKYRDAALDNNTIKANNYITFVYDGTNYVLISSSRGVANVFKGATSSAAGGIGIVPQPAAGDDGKYLRGDGTWAALSAGDIASGTLAAARLPAATASAQGAVKLGASGGAAAYSHNHAASAITSGILPVARGGTGNDTGYVTAGQKSGTTLGAKATAEGTGTTASGANCHAEGEGTAATDSSSHAEGRNTAARNGRAHAEGDGTTASGEASHAEGKGTTASGSFAHAEGNITTASGLYGSHAEGEGTTASGSSSHAEGAYTTASGSFAHAEGYETVAEGDDQHVFGKYNVSNTTDVEIVGWGTSSARKNIRTLDRSGNMTIAGRLTQSSDARLKDVAGEIPDVSGIRAVRFKWNDTNGEHDNEDHIGYLAQEVEKIAPYLVGDDSNGYKSLDYIALLCAKVETLERKVAELEGRG